MRLVLATNNRHKVTEIENILGNKYEILTLEDIGVKIKIIEDGTTFKENAAIKARTIARLTDYPVIADDSGLLVDALNGEPGVDTAIYAGEDASDDDNINKLLKNLEGVTFDNRTAKFVCVIALIQKNREIEYYTGECKGYILQKRSEGGSGFGYDPIFYYPQYDCSFAELEPSLKNAVSHRARALKKLMRALGENV